MAMLNNQMVNAYARWSLNGVQTGNLSFWPAKSSQIIKKQAIFHTYLNDQRVNTQSNHQLTALWLLLPESWSKPATTATSRHCCMRLHWNAPSFPLEGQWILNDLILAGNSKPILTKHLPYQVHPLSRNQVHQPKRSYSWIKKHQLVNDWWGYHVKSCLWKLSVPPGMIIIYLRKWWWPSQVPIDLLMTMMFSIKDCI